MLTTLTVASLAEAWIETIYSRPPVPVVVRRLPRGGVDRNIVCHVFRIFKPLVASLAEAWIETITIASIAIMPNVASLAEAWIETDHYRLNRHHAKVASLAEAWIETSRRC